MDKTTLKEFTKLNKGIDDLDMKIQSCREDIKEINGSIQDMEEKMFILIRDRDKLREKEVG